MREMRLPICLAVAVLLIAITANADMVVLKDGTSVRGSVLGREAVRAGAECAGLVSIVDAAGQMHEFDADEVDYVVIEGSGAPRIVRLMTDREASASTQQRGGSSSDATLIGGGLIIGCLGACVKFGGEKVEISGGEIRIQQHSYNGANYAMMGVGGAMILAGIMLDTASGEGYSSWAPAVGPGLSPISGDVGIAYCLRF